MAAKTFKRIPYGNSNFESIRTEKYAYVDKTRFIELLENENNKNQFFIRPRKFGKSLFLSLLTCYYDIRRTAQFERLFGDLYIGKRPTSRKNSYAVINFNFSGIDTSGENEFKISFSQRVQETVLSFIAAKTVYWEYIHRLIQESSPYLNVDTQLLDESVEAMAMKGDLHGYIDYVSNIELFR